MRLSKAAKYFDTSLAIDAYLNTGKIRCQLEPLDMYRTEGTRIKVRNLSTAPGVAIPSRRAIRLAGQVYLVSDPSIDEWNGKPVRVRYVLQGADEVFSIQTVAQALSGVVGRSAYGSLEFGKYLLDERDSSDYRPQYNIFFSGTETIHESQILSGGGKSFLVRNSYITPAGLVNTLVNELDSPLLKSASWASNVYDPVLDRYNSTINTTAVIRIRWHEHFENLSQGTSKYEKGDAQLLVPEAVSFTSSDVLEIEEESWRVLSIQIHGGYQTLHVRRT